MKNKKRGSSCFPFCFCEPLRLMHADFDLPRLSLFGFRDAYLQNAVFVRGLDAVVLYGFRKRKRAPEFSVNPLHSAVFDAVSCLLGLSLPGQSKRSIFYFQMEIFLLHFRKLGANQVRVFAFQNVYRWIPHGRTGLFPRAAKALPE